MAIRIGDLKIGNSYRGLRFSVSPRDIENGQPNDPCDCAAARGLKRKTGAKEVFVFRDVTYIVTGKEALRYKTPPALRLETVVFDRNGAFHPGEYDLQPAPEPVAKAKSASSRSKRKRAGGYRVIPNVRPTASQRLARI